jgi:hypothetical protein
MVVRNIGLVLAVLLFSLWGYERFMKSLSPSEVYLQAIESARRGDEEEFISCFTRESRIRIQGLLATVRNHAQIEISPYRHLSPLKIATEEVDGDRATLILHNEMDKVFLRKEDGDWKIDFMAEESSSKRSEEDGN